MGKPSILDSMRICHEGSGRTVGGAPYSNQIGYIVAATIAACLVLIGAAPAQAASYRGIRSVEYGSCVYAYSDPLEGIYLKKCTTTPATNGHWTVTVIGFHNNHQLWALKRQSGTCLGVGGTAANNYLYSSCTVTGSRNVWEVFPTSGRYVLKSFGAYQSWGQHRCLTFSGSRGGGRPQLGTCSLTSVTDQIYK
jgi:hypothetical protein